MFYQLPWQLQIRKLSFPEWPWVHNLAFLNLRFFTWNLDPNTKELLGEIHKFRSSESLAQSLVYSKMVSNICCSYYYNSLASEYYHGIQCSLAMNILEDYYIWNTHKTNLLSFHLALSSFQLQMNLYLEVT